MASNPQDPKAPDAKPFATKVAVTKAFDVQEPAPQPPPAGLPATIDEELERLDLGVPLVLLPVRVETRFARDRARFLVRVFPDEIFADGHEPALTEEEHEAGSHYWQSVREGAREADAWRSLTQRFPTPRAAWIVRCLEPTDLGPEGRLSGGGTSPGTSRRASAWTRPTLARALPERWVLVLYVRGARRTPVVGAPIRRDLALTLDPRRSAATTTFGGITLDSGARWLVDFSAALDAGMAFDLPADAEMTTHGIERLLVVGVRSTLDPVASAAELEALFDAHHYHAGLAFVPQGTPTTNTQRFKTGFPPNDPSGGRSFAVERRYTAPDGDGRRLAAMLGLREDLFDRVSGADLHERADARAMMTALWPATLGYWLSVMMEPLVSVEAQAELQKYAIENVQGRGPFTILRVGRVPYGILPITHLDRWKTASGDPAVEAPLVRLLNTLRPFWQEASSQVPELSRRAEDPGPDGPSPDPDVSVFRVLTLLASSTEIRRRVAIGGDFIRQLLEIHAARQTEYWRQHLALTLAPLRRIGHFTTEPRLTQMLHLNLPERVDLPLVGGSPDGQVDYLALLRAASLTALQRDEVLDPDAVRPWLYRLLRHARLLEFRRITRELLTRADSSLASMPAEPELIEVPGFARSTTALFEARPPADLGILTFNQYFGSSEARAEHPPLGEFERAVAALEALRRPELERLFTETLDVCSHRLDAWMTAVATRRLEALRQTRRRGVVLGAWAWVEGIRFDTTLRPAPDVAGVYRQEGAYGYVHAPSVDQAATGAILRNAYMQRYGAERDAVAVDLAPPRVRGALRLLDGVRQGAPLAGLLGQQFERGLRARGDAYMRFVDGLRRVFPLAPPVTPRESGADEIFPQDVVDGLALRANRARAQAVLDAARATEDERRGFDAEVAALEESLDAVSDLLTAESVFQTIKGSGGVAGASLAALARGERPPEPEVVRTPREGRGVTHRLIVRLPAVGFQRLRSWGALDARTPRASASRVLEAWLESLLGAPETLACHVRYEVEIGGAWTEAPPRRVTVADLGLRAVDLLALLRDDDLMHPASEFQLRVATLLRRLVPGSRECRVDLFARGTDGAGKTLGEVFAILRLVRSVVSRARPLGPDDMQGPHTATGPVGRMEYTAALRDDVDAQRVALGTLADQLDVALQRSGALSRDVTGETEGLEELLRQAARFGIERAFPPPARGSPQERIGALRAQAEGVRVEARRRVTASGGAGDPIARAKVLFGEDFIVFGTFAPEDSNTLAAFGDEGFLENADIPWKWLQQSARVRPRVESVSRMLAALRALGATWTFQIAQLPRGVGRWAGWFGEGPLPASEVVSLAVLSPSSLDSPHWAAVVVDEWLERIPSTEQTTGLAFHYNDPGAEAAQTILVAVPPALDQRWSLDLLERMLWETFENARLRAVTPDLLGALGQYLPALFLAENPRNETVSTGLSGHVRDEPFIAPEE